MSAELTGPGELDDREPSRDEASRPDRNHHDGHGPDDRADAALGDVVAGRYELGAVIGRGGSATVYRAWDRDDERPVALKRYPAGATGPDRFRQDQELHMLSGLDHPGLVAMYDAGTDGARPYLVMQLVDGPSLTERLVDGPLPVPDVVEIGRHLASALRYVHAHGITHRDVKPANVLLDDGHRPLLADFGIALLVDATRVTDGDAVVGTAAYLAPEQVRGEAIGPPADIYALGLVLIESITGASAYPGTSAESVVARVDHGPVVPSDLPGGCTPLLERMTAVDVTRRPDARGVVGELAAVADRIAENRVAMNPITASRVAENLVAENLVAENLVAANRPGAAVAAPGRRPRRRLAVGLSLAAGAAVLAVAGGSVAGLAAGRAPAPAAIAAPAPAAKPVVAPPVAVAVAPPVVPAPSVSSGVSSGRAGSSAHVVAPEPSPVEVPVHQQEGSPSSSGPALMNGSDDPGAGSGDDGQNDGAKQDGQDDSAHQDGQDDSAKQDGQDDSAKQKSQDHHESDDGDSTDRHRSSSDDDD